MPNDSRDDEALVAGTILCAPRACRDECRGPIVQTSLTSCLDQCAPPLDEARATCKVQVECRGSDKPCGFNLAYIACIYPAQRVAFGCRGALRLNVGT